MNSVLGPHFLEVRKGMIDMSIIGHKDFEYTHTLVPGSSFGGTKLISWVQYTNKVINVQSGRNRSIYLVFSLMNASN